MAALFHRRRHSTSSSDTNSHNHLDEVTLERPSSPAYRTGILRGDDGIITYPGFVPPSVQSPEPPVAGLSALDGPMAPNGLAPNGVQAEDYVSVRQEDEESEQTPNGDLSEDDDGEVSDPIPPPRKSNTLPARLNKVKSATPGRHAPPVPILKKVQSAASGRRSVPPIVRPPATRDWQTEIAKPGSHAQAPYRPSHRGSGTSYLNTAIWQRCDKEYESSDTSDEEHHVPCADSWAQKQADKYKADREKKRRQEKCQQKRKDHLLEGSNADDRYRRFLVGNENYQTKGKMKKDGRLRITVNETASTGYIAKALGAAIHKMKPVKDGEEPASIRSRTSAKLSPASSFSTLDLEPRPRLNIVIMVIGSRGDVQPFLKIGKVLKEEYGHRVRIATHPAFREYIERDSGLEFFSVGGDPSELMAFMVKNPGMIPTLETVRAGDIGKRRAAMAEMFDGFWRACVNATDDEKDSQNLKMMGAKDPFVADAIIANPPCFAHVHCAEALGVPLHLMFTFPYTPTQAFPHPLATIKKSNVDPGYTNFISYPMVEMMVWQGLGDLINEFRINTLGLDPVSTLWAPGATYRMHVPFTYLWSPGLVPKPRDWGEHIDISGFVYLDLASSFTPPDDLKEFLDAGEPPIYIGFGSIVVDDADRFTQMIFEAVEKAGVRALVSRGWGGLGSTETPENVFMLDNTPHDWLFPRVKACVIHGGAGTTAIALKLAKPTMVVPFFGDQHFWGKMVSSSGVGPEPVPYKNLTADKLAEGIRYCLTDEAQTASDKIAESIEREGDGAHNAVKAFHRHLNLRGPNTMRCSLLKDQIASWQPKNTHVKLSPLAADILVDAGFLSWRKLRLLRHQEWNDFEGPGEPVTGIAGSLTHTVGNAFKGVGGVPVKLAKTSSRYRRRMTKKRQKKREKERLAAAADSGTPPNEAMANVEIGTVDGDVTLAEQQNALQATRTTTNDIHDEFVDDVTAGVGLTATAIAMAPIDLSLALAQGFHNAPRLYGDDTVRKPIRITGIHSGLVAARKEFTYGIYDAFTGLVRLPIRGAKQRGVTGFVKGCGMGVLGLVVKNVSAIIGPFGYTAKGLVKQAKRRKSPSRFIRRARIIQGQREAQALGYPSERKRLEKDVVEGYHIMRDLCDAIQAQERQRGLAGQLDRVFIDTGMLFEDTQIAQRALRALRRGESLETITRPPGEEKRWCRGVAEKVKVNGNSKNGKDGEGKRARLVKRWRRDKEGIRAEKTDSSVAPAGA